jgi:hypothetical protein
MVAKPPEVVEVEPVGGGVGDPPLELPHPATPEK